MCQSQSPSLSLLCVKYFKENPTIRLFYPYVLRDTSLKKIHFFFMQPQCHYYPSNKINSNSNSLVSPTTSPFWAIPSSSKMNVFSQLVCSNQDVNKVHTLYLVDILRVPPPPPTLSLIVENLSQLSYRRICLSAPSWFYLSSSSILHISCKLEMNANFQGQEAALCTPCSVISGHVLSVSLSVTHVTICHTYCVPHS